MAGVAAALPADGFERVAITYRNTPPDRTIAAIEAASASAFAVRVDFLQPEAEIASALEQLVREYGPFDTLVHGVGPIVVKRFERLSMDDYREMLDGNLRSAVLATRAVAGGDARAALRAHRVLRNRRFGRDAAASRLRILSSCKERAGRVRAILGAGRGS